MNEFYSIAQENTSPENEWQLKNLGVERISMSWAPRGSRNRYDVDPPITHQYKVKVKREDYDREFALKITGINPPYELDKLINYHLDYYIKKGGDENKFIKHVQYVVLPYLQKLFEKKKAHIELTEQWIENIKKIKFAMIEYYELSEIEKQAINRLIASTPQDILSSQYLWIKKTEVDELFNDDAEYHSKRLMNFLLANDFIKLRAYDGTYYIEPEGRKLFKYGTVEKYFEKLKQQHVQAHQSVVGDGNIVINSGGDVTQSGITINMNQQDYAKLKELGIEETKIEELKKMIETNKNDTPSFVKNCMKWLGEVSKQVATKGLIDNLPNINEYVTHLITSIS